MHTPRRFFSRLRRRLRPVSSCFLFFFLFFPRHPFEARTKNTKNKRAALQRSTEEALRPLKRCRAICGEPRLILSRETRILQNNAASTRFKVAISKVAQTLTKLGARLCEFSSIPQLFFFSPDFQLEQSTRS